MREVRHVHAVQLEVVYHPLLLSRQLVAESLQQAGEDARTVHARNKHSGISPASPPNNKLVPQLQRHAWPERLNKQMVVGAGLGLRLPCDGGSRASPEPQGSVHPLFKHVRVAQGL